MYIAVIPASYLTLGIWQDTGSCTPETQQCVSLLPLSRDTNAGSLAVVHRRPYSQRQKVLACWYDAARSAFSTQQSFGYRYRTVPNRPYRVGRYGILSKSNPRSPAAVPTECLVKPTRRVSDLWVVCHFLAVPTAPSDVRTMHGQVL